MRCFYGAFERRTTMRLENKVILITASTRGIGLACVKACAKEGAIVYMAAPKLLGLKERG